MFLIFERFLKDIFKLKYFPVFLCGLYPLHKIIHISACFLFDILYIDTFNGH